MARGTQFLALQTRLRAELKRSSDVSVGVEDLNPLKETLNHVYAVLYMQRDWPHLKKVFSLPLVAGEQYYDIPTGLNSERVLEAWSVLSNVRTPIERGISQEHYAEIDPGEDERSDPALRWDVRWTGSTDQIEIWPLPVTSSQVAKFDGFQSISRLVNDTDQCLLDDTLVVLFAAAELMKGDEAKVKLGLAQDHMKMLFARASGRGNGERLGLGHYDEERRPRITVRVS